MFKCNDNLFFHITLCQNVCNQFSITILEIYLRSILSDMVCLISIFSWNRTIIFPINVTKYFYFLFTAVGWFNFSKSDKNQVATLILLKFNIIFYVEKKSSDQSGDVWDSARSSKFALWSELYSLEKLHCTVFSVKWA
jgi:hypothetical protein